MVCFIGYTLRRVENTGLSQQRRNTNAGKGTATTAASSTAADTVALRTPAAHPHHCVGASAGDVLQVCLAVGLVASVQTHLGVHSLS